MNQIKVKVVNKGNQELPMYATPQSAGMDLRADIESSITLFPMERKLIPTGLHIQLPSGFEAMVRPRSGLALKNGITVLNTPGCVDADFRGNIGVILINLSDQAFEIQPGDRIAQLVISPVVQAVWIEDEPLDDTERGEGGFGHSGIK